MCNWNAANLGWTSFPCRNAAYYCLLQDCNVFNANEATKQTRPHTESRAIRHCKMRRREVLVDTHRKRLKQTDLQPEPEEGIVGLTYKTKEWQ